MRRLGRVVGLALIALTPCGACGTNPEQDRASAAEASPTTVAEPQPPTPASADEVGPAGDWDGELFDFGRIVSVHDDGSRRLLVFDRMEVVGDDGVRRSGATLTAEPIVVANSDTPFTDATPQLRTFVVAADVVVKRLSPLWTCGADGPPAPTWDQVGFDTLVHDGVGADSQDSLTFDEHGQVVQIRLSRGC